MFLKHQQPSQGAHSAAGGHGPGEESTKATPGAHPAPHTPGLGLCLSSQPFPWAAGCWQTESFGFNLDVAPEVRVASQSTTHPLHISQVLQTRGCEGRARISATQYEQLCV